MEGQEVAIPKAEFIEDVEKYMADKEVDKVLLELVDNIRIFRMKEQELLQKRARLAGKLPELQRSLDIVEEIIKAQENESEITTDFELSTGVYAKAQIKSVKTINLWLGANVMLEYPLDEAKQLLEQNLESCRSNLKINDENLDSMKDSITVSEVSQARIFNYDIQRRKMMKAQE
uniref:Prefoldin subunit 3 n=1 Tax=Polytomella parva TaxID=51329 RepID=A0A7S0YJW8_9CHLO|mmetsp:Transcript_30273/g.55298  ORF Transcript_30273/g.55298 Transcript_30273/m.55298 type:complete len:175 (+) Transcript_30273:86-610(+)